MFEQLLVTDKGIGPDPGTWSWSGAKGELLGVVTSDQLIDGASLTTLAGITQGTAINNTAGWLHFNFRDKELYVAKMPLRHSITFKHLSDLNLVDGSKIIDIAGISYKLRLLRGQNIETFAGARTSDGPTTYYSEYNKLMYLASNGTFTNAVKILAREGISTSELGGFTEAQLGTGGSLLGRYNWVIEHDSTNASFRGGPNITTIWYNAIGTIGTDLGWRPVLERV